MSKETKHAWLELRGRDVVVRFNEQTQATFSSKTDEIAYALFTALHATKAVELGPVPKTGSLREALRASHEAGGCAWDAVKDPEALLAEIRGACAFSAGRC